MADEPQNNVKEAPPTSPAAFNPVSSIVRRQVRAPAARGTFTTRASHKNWRRTLRLLKSLGKTL